MNLLECKSLKVGYGCEKPALIECANFDLAAGEVVALMGENGSGKSTLLKTLAGFIEPLSGQALLNVDGVSFKNVRELGLRQVARNLALVRMSNVAPARFTVREFVGLGRMPYSGFLDGRSADDERIVESAMSLLDVLHFAERPVAELSDGERSRVYLAEAVAQQVRVLLLDEPNAFLDIPRSHALFNMLRNLAESKGMGIIVSTHSMEYAEKYCHRIMVVDGGNVRVGRAHEAREMGLFDWTERK